MARRGYVRSASPLERFSARTVITASGCWEWQGATDPNGYGRISWPGFPALVHRAMWVTMYGPIGAGLFVCHRCDNPPCVNPDHLFLGTRLDNIRDMVEKGRAMHTHCHAGHDLSVHGRWRSDSHGRKCRICQRDQMREWKRRRAGGLPQRPLVSGAA
jgi:hypothetical protein